MGGTAVLVSGLGTIGRLLSVIAFVSALSVAAPLVSADASEPGKSELAASTGAGASPGGGPEDGADDPLLLSGQDYLKNLGPYKPMYFLFGIPLSESKFQLSFKYRLFTSAAPVALRHPWATGIHVGYTQASFWDLRSDSKPFEDTSYMPEAFYVSRNLAWRPRAVDGLFLHAGVQHESNGRGGDASRSINMVYLSPIFAFRFPNTRLDVGIAPRIKLYFDDSENPDLEDYRGHADVALAFGSAHGPVLKANLRAARRGTSVEIDATYPLSRSWVESAQIYLHAQYTNTLAERLLDYSERREAFRIGLSFFR